ncbi:glutaredoxin domain-containing protein [Mesorhizobium sp. M00.F.Ca.ET.216.01.1.1]|uniref:glutaredoxin domain-containing protein n=1 Tax=Mesorhizobium sp. M00.F.Ca.ET.216.01.1.1 TaxID=2500528 RepID=UPI001FE21A13|nr:glutaredoxin domain-containing protein [Mesorhizobium sp. M00.F.Ca.ET.216.01.1.1]
MVTNDNSKPVVLFALEWCEFCWSVRRLFKAMDVTYRSIDLDSVEYQKDGWGGDVRVALRKVTGAPTIPQIFVGGKHIGGCTETLDAFNDGSLQALLNASRVSFDADKVLDAYTLLPNWLHPR